MSDTSNDFDYNSLDLTASANELYGDGSIQSEVQEKPTETVEDTGSKGEGAETKEVEENDNPFAETEEKKEEKSDDPDDEVLKKLELEEKWRVKRLNKEIEKTRAAEAEAARLKAEMEALKAGRGSQEQKQEQPANQQFDDAKFAQALVAEDPHIKALHEKVEYIKGMKESFEDMGAYADALLDAQSELKSEIKDRKREFLEYQRQVAQTQVQSGNKILEEFGAKIESAKEAFPMVDKARELLESRAGELHVEIRRALLTDENAGELTWAIGSSKKNLQYLIEASQIATKTGTLPIDAIKMMGKWSSEIKGAKGTGESSVPKKVPTKPAGVPKDIRSKPVANHDDMDPYEYATKLLSGKIRNDLY